MRAKLCGYSVTSILTRILLRILVDLNSSTTHSIRISMSLLLARGQLNTFSASAMQIVAEEGQLLECSASYTLHARLGDGKYSVSSL